MAMPLVGSRQRLVNIGIFMTPNLQRIGSYVRGMALCLLAICQLGCEQPFKEKRGKVVSICRGTVPLQGLVQTHVVLELDGGREPYTIMGDAALVLGEALNKEAKLSFTQPIPDSVITLGDNPKVISEGEKGDIKSCK